MKTYRLVAYHFVRFVLRPASANPLVANLTIPCALKASGAPRNELAITSERTPTDFARPGVARVCHLMPSSLASATTSISTVAVRVRPQCFATLARSLRTSGLNLNDVGFFMFEPIVAMKGLRRKVLRYTNAEDE